MYSTIRGSAWIESLLPQGLWIEMETGWLSAELHYCWWLFVFFRGVRVSNKYDCSLGRAAENCWIFPYTCQVYFSFQKHFSIYKPFPNSWKPYEGNSSNVISTSHQMNRQRGAGWEGCPAGPGLEPGSEVQSCAYLLRLGCLSVQGSRVSFPTACKKLCFCMNT